MSKTNKSLKYTCIFGGGAIRGISYVGTVKALEELGIHSNTIAGSSVGAIFAGLVSVGYTAEELREIFNQVNYELFKDVYFGFRKGFALSKGEIFLDWLRNLIEKKFYGENSNNEGTRPVTFSDLDKNLVVIATDLTNFSVKEFSKFETPDFEIAYAIRISASMPGLMLPIEDKGSLLVDGDLQKSWPFWKLSKSLWPGEERILEFRTEGGYEDKDQNAISFMNTIYSCMTSLATDFIIDSYGYRDKFDYIKINTGSVVVVDFNISQEKRQRLMDIGYQETKNYFNKFLPEKKKEIVKYYREVSKHISKIKKCIFSNKIKQAKDELGLLYMNLFPAKKIIDFKIYDMIDEFKENFLKNLSPVSILGFYCLTNANLIKTQINSIDYLLEEKVMELENYIFKLDNL